ncbi:hypothetical protein C1645_837117 [Glomus cerebriforme]|uniref:Uncharacterized protein n=1 Tax=Glomus cerebriforme TaxID=658196 RepID=A0A397SG08_9GLOM|nr:hypothetical protein C1645_837117 [Glomus cerebriforme]
MPAIRNNIPLQLKKFIKPTCHPLKCDIYQILLSIYKYFKLQTHFSEKKKTSSKRVLGENNFQETKKIKHPEALQEFFIIKNKTKLILKNYELTSIAEVTSLIKTYFSGLGIREIINGISVSFFKREQKIEKYLIIKWQRNLISYELYVLEKSVKEINRIETGIATKRTLSEISEMIHYVSMAKICIGQKTEGIELIII